MKVSVTGCTRVIYPADLTSYSAIVERSYSFMVVFGIDMKVADTLLPQTQDGTFGRRNSSRISIETIEVTGGFTNMAGMFVSSGSVKPVTLTSSLVIYVVFCLSSASFGLALAHC